MIACAMSVVDQFVLGSLGVLALVVTLAWWAS